MRDFSKFVVCAVIVMNIIFCIAVFAVFWHTGNEPATLIAGWFSFTTVELWGLSKIKRDKLAQNDEEDDKND